MSVEKPADKISLRDAVEKPMWKIICATEPDRPVDVRMSYTDLEIICKLIEESRDRNERNV